MDMQIREVINTTGIPDRIAHLIKTLEKEDSKVAVFNGIKTIYDKIRSAKERHQ
jgi:hypothetical protein